jgi:hypothetical protein
MNTFVSHFKAGDNDQLQDADPGEGEVEPDEADDAEEKVRSDPVFGADDAEEPDSDFEESTTQAEALAGQGRVDYHPLAASSPPSSTLSSIQTGDNIIFKWSTGWCFAVVTRKYTPPRSRHKFNFELLYPDEGDSRHDHCLSMNNYNRDVDADVGSWALCKQQEPAMANQDSM